ncbi:hypothetical protein PsexTeo8_31820 [Pseudomonas extremaustralis]|nr:hypothetical protein [Pseudomonas extremaustralis]
MLWLKLIFCTPAKFRNFIRVDQNGVCVEYIRCKQSPGNSWVEVDEFCLNWLGKPLPGHACKTSLGRTPLLPKRLPEGPDY